MNNYIKPVENDENKINRNKIHKEIMELCGNNIALSSYIGKKIKNITIDYGVLYIMLSENMTQLKYKIPTITHPIGKVNYIFTVLEAKINR